jgi:hypothetical protein
MVIQLIDQSGLATSSSTNFDTWVVARRLCESLHVVGRQPVASNKRIHGYAGVEDKCSHWSLQKISVFTFFFC